MSVAAIDRVRLAEGRASELPQVPITTEHMIHGGLYLRTVRLPAGVRITGALVKRATALIVHGDAVAYLGEETIRLCGYNVLPASAGRKQVFVALSETVLTMILPTDAKTVDEAERQFTDELEILASRRDPDSNQIVVTGE